MCEKLNIFANYIHSIHRVKDNKQKFKTRRNCMDCNESLMFMMEIRKMTIDHPLNVYAPPAMK